MTNRAVHMTTELANAAFAIGMLDAKLTNSPDDYATKNNLFLNRGRYEAIAEMCTLWGIAVTPDWEKHPAYAEGKNCKK